MSNETGGHTVTPHQGDRKNVGKYDCHYDSWLHGDLLEMVDFIGDTGDFGVVTWTYDLEADCPGHPDDDYSIAAGLPAGVSHECDGTCTDEGRAAKHYGAPWLTIQEDSQGFVSVAAYDTEDARDAEYQRISELYDAWVTQETGVTS